MLARTINNNKVHLANAKTIGLTMEFKTHREVPNKATRFGLHMGHKMGSKMLKDVNDVDVPRYQVS